MISRRRFLTGAGAAAATATFTAKADRTMPSKGAKNAVTLDNLLYPEQFGCTGDGSTDDSTNFTKAATAATGKTLKLTPEATYILAAVDIPAHSSGTVIDMTGAAVKLKVLGTNVGAPIFNVTGTGKVKFINGEIDGQKSSQPADGFSDSFNGGGGGKGRAYRAAIKADATVATGVSEVVVLGTRFKNTYGSPVATQDVPTVIVKDCHAVTCNFEIAYGNYSAGTLLDFQVINNIIDTPASGHPSVNANGAFCTRYRRVKISGNVCNNAERNLVKVSGGEDIQITNNIVHTNTQTNFTGIQVDCQSAWKTGRVTINGNKLYNTNAGIQVSVSGNPPDTVIITDNSIYTTTGANTGDGIRVDKATNLTIADNHCKDVKRHGIYLSHGCSVVQIHDNTLHGQGTSGQIGILLSASDADFGTVSIIKNHVENFQQIPNGSGVVVLERSASFMYAKALVRGNKILAGSSSNRGVRIAADCVTTGLLSDNYVDGQLETASASLLVKDNTVTGRVILPRR